MRAKLKTLTGFETALRICDYVTRPFATPTRPVTDADFLSEREANCRTFMVFLLCRGAGQRRGCGQRSEC